MDPGRQASDYSFRLAYQPGQLPLRSDLLRIALRYPKTGNLLRAYTGGRSHREDVHFIFLSGNRWRPNLDRSRIGTPFWA